MKAAIRRRYGPPEVLELAEVATPAPGPHEVRVRVAASSVTSGDARLRGCTDAGIFWLPIRLIFGLRRPRRPIAGMEFAGRVDAIGPGVTRLRPGDAVFGMTSGSGANAEYLTIREDAAIAAMPARLSAAEAAAVPFGALSALEFLRDVARLREGERILVHGASGGVGVFAVQLARHFGAHVTAVCSAANAALVRGLGAHDVIDYAAADFTAGNATYDVILDVVGGTDPARCRRVLAPGGRHVFVAFGLREMLWMLGTWLGGGRRVVCGTSGARRQDLDWIAERLGSGALRPVIDRRFGLADIIAAHRHVETGRKRGSVVIEVAAPG
ncbi:NAD(P)-dependent alcohol dehydrogenase [Roseomonas sp. CECT 9278]|uniref:NAD(P)-dependent alcohol dehydrogenase n=1 Tax=Roseomonas sp. CECT 9278 TaxID=2845823 RepID=UPI001E45E310|nr:NAD(P)-dependent alcohol dehydrogenase [Roseomonas sp. CECT 9278]CAH0248451.1 Narbonolide/10-deoxymethynolide synthase PikA2, modules 3 and 4 [Roseomonas sp. CECT 9278]